MAAGSIPAGASALTPHKMDKKRIRVGILFGGRSAEHEISLLSAKNVIDALDRS